MTRRNTKKSRGILYLKMNPLVFKDSPEQLTNETKWKKIRKNWAWLKQNKVSSQFFLSDSKPSSLNRNKTL